jgi:hypothetical protein
MERWNGRILPITREFYQLLTYKDDVDLTKKLSEWEHIYNFERLHGAHAGKTPMCCTKKRPVLLT